MPTTDTAHRPGDKPAMTYWSGGRPELSQTCDRCRPAVRAVYRVRRNGELYLCRHCANQLRSALSAQGWTIWLIDEYALTPHAT